MAPENCAYLSNEDAKHKKTSFNGQAPVDSRFGKEIHQFVLSQLIQFHFMFNTEFIMQISALTQVREVLFHGCF